MKAQMFNFNSWVTETNPVTLFEYYETSLIEAGFNILETIEHNFKPQGYTALFLLSESHFAIHTFPEHNKTYIELTSCVKEQFDKFIETTKKQRYARI
jgi:S-adenosylmethionine decarboxylase